MLSHLAGLLLVAALAAGSLGHFLDGVLDVLPLLVEVVLEPVCGNVVVRFRLAKKKTHSKKNDKGFSCTRDTARREPRSTRRQRKKINQALR